MEKWYETHAPTCTKILWIFFGRKSEIDFFYFFLFSLEFGNFIPREYAHMKAYKKLIKNAYDFFGKNKEILLKKIFFSKIFDFSRTKNRFFENFEPKYGVLCRINPKFDIVRGGAGENEQF